MNATATPHARSLVLVLVAALSLGLVGTVHAQDNAVEDLLAGVMTESLTGAHITCPPGRQTSAISACFLLSNNVANSQVLIDRFVASQTGVEWSIPWVANAGDPSRVRIMTIQLADGIGSVSMFVALHPDAGAPYQTVVWITDANRAMAVLPEGD